MQNVRIFNGYIGASAFNTIHQSPSQMLKWGQELEDAANGNVLTFRGWKLEDCWAHRMVQGIPGEVFSADHPNEPKDRYVTPQDALRSQCLLHQRFEWLSIAARMYPEVDVWAWVEFTIFKQRGLTRDVVQQFLREVAEHPIDAISLPGVWEKKPVIDSVNHWRFAGSAWVCPRQYAQPVFEAVKTLVTMRTKLTHRLCWDNSTWSYLELLNVLPMRWYPGNHDETQLTGFLK